MKLSSLAAVLGGLTLSAAASAQPVDLVLRLNGRVPMETLARNVMDPTSPRYRQFYTPAEIRDLAGPSDAEYQTLLNNLKSEGLTVVHESPTHLLVTVRGEHDVAERLFAVRMAFAEGGKRSFTGDVRVPAHLSPVVSVTGLDNTRQSHPKFVRPADGLGGSGVPLATIRTLYGFDGLYSQGLSGAGQHLAIATYDDIDLSVVNSYYSQNNVSPAPTVDKVTFNGTPKSNDNSAMETAVDAEFSGALAPQAQIHIFTSATNDDAGELAVFTAILDDNRAKVANYSWGDCEVNLKDQHKTDMAAVFERAVAQGVNITVATGDSGSACPTSVDSSGQPNGYTDPMADWPAARPDVVAVGGTTLDTTKNALSETAWSGGGSSGGSGGGISTLWALPTWQQGLGAPYTMRSYPDVSFNANPSSGQSALVLEYGFPLSTVIGGTSIAAPQWAAFIVLVGEARAKAGKAPVGFIDPVIYAMSANDKANSFDDVTSGNNGKYTAGAGWDAVTGWGSMHASSLLPYLVAH